MGSPNQELRSGRPTLGTFPVQLGYIADYSGGVPNPGQLNRNTVLL